MVNSSPEIIILDDETDYADTLLRQFKKITERVQAVTSFEQLRALDLTATRCLILDFYLTNSENKYRDTGLKVLSWMHENHQDIKVILHSAQAEPGDITQAEVFGAEYMPKQENFSRVVDLVRPLLADDHPSTPESAFTGEIERLQSENARLTIEKNGADQRIYSSEARINAHRQVMEQLKNVVSFTSNSAASGRRPGEILDNILRDLTERAGVKRAAWFLIAQANKPFISKNCRFLGRSIPMGNKPEKTLGTKLWKKVQAHGLDPSIIGPLTIEVEGAEIPGIFHGHIVYACIFYIEAYKDRLLFVLEDPVNEAPEAQAGPSSQSPTFKTYVDALHSIVNILPLHNITQSEFQVADDLARWTEDLVSWGQVVGRASMSLLSFTLFAAAILSSFFAVAVLVTAVAGFPHALDFMSKGFHWNPGNYAVGIVTALEIFILAITLYLLGVGLAVMTDHQRLLKVTQSMRYLDNPAEMKKTLILAVSTLLAVAGLREIFELDLFDPVRDWKRQLAEFGGKMAFLTLLIVVLTYLFSKWSGEIAGSNQLDKPE